MRHLSYRQIVDNMAGVIQNPTKMDQRAVIQFLTCEGCQPVNIYRRMQAAYGDKCVSKTTVKDWIRMFREGREITKDLPRPGQDQVVVTEEVIDKIDAALREDPRRSLRSLAEEFDVSFGTVQTVVRKKLRYQKVCSQWVPPMGTDQDSPNCIAMEIGEAAVKDYYGNKLTSSEDLTTTDVIQCTSNLEQLAKFVTEALSLVHADIKNRFSNRKQTYGCATAYPEALDGAKVLDLGAGSGRDCFVLSNIVGEDGTVVGLDMTDELLQLARDKVDYHTSKYGYAKPNVSFVKGYMENMKEAGINDDFFDVIVSNCVISLCTDKRAVLREAYRVLKPGGELYFSDMYREGQLPPEVLDDKKLWCEGLIGALTCTELHDIAKELGFTTPRVVRASSLPILDEEIKNKLSQVRYASVTYRLFKRLNRNDQDNKSSAVVKYLGGIRGCEDRFTFDKIYTFKKGETTTVDPEVASILSTSRFATFFDVVPASEQSTHSFQIVDPFKLI